MDGSQVLVAGLASGGLLTGIAALAGVLVNMRAGRAKVSVDQRTVANRELEVAVQFLGEERQRLEDRVAELGRDLDDERRRVSSLERELVVANRRIADLERGAH